MEQFWHAFIPLFVAFDGVGVLPVFLSLTHRLPPTVRRLAAQQAVMTAFLVTLIFALISSHIFELMGLQFADVMMAGGAILIVLCLRDLLLPSDREADEQASPGMVPLGVPLLAGPAVLTTVVLVKDQLGWPVTLLALVANMAVVWAVLGSSGQLMRWLGRQGSQLMSKVFSLVLTAYGVMLIRRGVFGLMR